MKWFQIKAALLEAHKHTDIYLSYLVAGSVSLQASWNDMDQYIPPKWRHTVLGIATAVIIFDRMRKAIRNTRTSS